jgi:hypothetical protein
MTPLTRAAEPTWTFPANVWGYSPAKPMLRGPVFWGNGGRLGENN